MAHTGYSFWFQWEPAIIIWLQEHLGDTAIRVLSVFSAIGEPALTALVIGFVYWCYSKKMGKYLGLNIMMALVWNTMLKNVFLRRRPYFDHDRIDIKRPVEPDADLHSIAAQGYSFPSGHSTNSATVFGSLAAYAGGWTGRFRDDKIQPFPDRVRRITLAAAIVLPLLVGVSRVAVGAHYPTDVLVGWLTGAAAIWIVPFLSKKIRNRAAFNLFLLAVSLPGLIYCRSEDYFSALGLLIGFMAGTEFEERFVNFKETRSPAWSIVRVLCGVIVFFAIDRILKIPFSREFLKGESYAALLVRAVRYAMMAFGAFGMYPFLFRYEEVVSRKKDKED